MPTGAQIPIGFKRLQPIPIFFPDSRALPESVDAIHISHGLIGDGTADIVFSRESVWHRQILNIVVGRALNRPGSQRGSKDCCVTG
jgi:hypothetical protein